MQRPLLSGASRRSALQRPTVGTALRTDHETELDRIRRDTTAAGHHVAAEHAETVRQLRADLSAAAERRATEHAPQ
ncbi:MAG: hypothetical protein JWR58_2619, partial [Pseudonocardia sp.]|nr:hypothetical protein [Pseudonocardia sp.]